MLFKRDESKIIVKQKDFFNRMQTVSAAIEHSINSAGENLKNYELKISLLQLSDHLKRFTHDKYIKFSLADLNAITSYLNRDIDKVMEYAYSGDEIKGAYAAALVANLRLFLIKNFTDGKIRYSIEDSETNEKCACLDCDIEGFQRQLISLNKKRAEKLKELNALKEEALSGAILEEEESIKKLDYDNLERAIERIDTDISMFEEQLDLAVQTLNKNQRYKGVQISIEVLRKYTTAFTIYTEEDLQRVVNDYQKAQEEKYQKDTSDDAYYSVVNSYRAKKEKSSPFDEALKTGREKKIEMEAQKAQKEADDRLFAPKMNEKKD